MTLEDLYRLLRSGHEQAQGIVDTIDRPLVVLDQTLTVVNANPAFHCAFCVERDETLGHRLTELGNGQWNIPELERLLLQVIPKSAAVVGYEISHDFPKIGKRTILVTARRLVHPDTNSIFMLVVFDDVTDQRHSTAAQDIVSGEIRHRFKNFLGVVGALARQTPVAGRTAGEFRESLVQRLEALIQAEMLLFSDEQLDLAKLIEVVLSPYADQMKIESGPVVALSKKQVRPITMILHELATNSLKHGALSSEHGRLHLGWSMAEGNPPGFVLDWREEGGPKVAPPDHDGFGTRLITFSAITDLDYAPEGLRARIEVPSVRWPGAAGG